MSDSNPQLRREVDQIVNAPDLDRAQKIEQLRQLSYDARELEVAIEEGMSGPAPGLEIILAALRALGADVKGTDTKQ